MSGPELGTLSFSLSRFPSHGTLVFPWPGMNFLLNPCLFLIMLPSHAYHTLCVSKREKKTWWCRRLRRRTCGKTLKALARDQGSLRTCEKTLKTPARDQQKAPLEYDHLCNLELCKNDLSKKKGTYRPPESVLETWPDRRLSMQGQDLTTL